MASLKNFSHGPASTINFKANIFSKRNVYQVFKCARAHLKEPSQGSEFIDTNEMLFCINFSMQRKVKEFNPAQKLPKTEVASLQNK